MFVRDATGTHREAFLLTTDTARTADGVVGTYCGRWSIETTFPECRSCVGVGSIRGRSRRTVLRAALCLSGLYSVVAILYHSLPERKRAGGVAWAGKATVTFSDALTAVLRWIWAEGVFKEAEIGGTIAELPEHVREHVLSGLAPAP